MGHLIERFHDGFRMKISALGAVLGSLNWEISQWKGGNWEWFRDALGHPTRISPNGKEGNESFGGGLGHPTGRSPDEKEEIESFRGDFRAHGPEISRWNGGFRMRFVRKTQCTLIDSDWVFSVNPIRCTIELKFSKEL